ncbi:MAG: hypothetical protein UW17_C0042G0005 [Candidatus Nomurabacteria bacterium GW2011_GWD1_44_10]|nr:MAG: hypothetical protein UW17_C0042G0005 [Candidatus Nomurabacteria bacterium GW2011_GWD1_44_10]
MKKEDSATRDMSSPKHSYHARKEASTTQADGNPSGTEPKQSKRVIVSEESEMFDVPHMQYF